jgi:hypothetical protein
MKYYFVVFQFLFSGGMTLSIAACLAIGKNLSENITNLLLFTEL